MGFRENIWFAEKSEIQELDRVPWWARAEHMEMNISIKELTGYPESAMSRKSTFTKILKLIGR